MLGILTCSCTLTRALEDRKHAYELIAKQAERERNVEIKPAWRDDCGWGRPGSEYAGVHFRTFIGSSLRLLHSHATKRAPSLQLEKEKHEPAEDISQLDFSYSLLACDVEDYLARLRIAMNGDVSQDVCNQFLAFYRNARTPGRQCTEQEFRSFLGVFQEMLRRIER